MKLKEDQNKRTHTHKQNEKIIKGQSNEILIESEHNRGDQQSKKLVFQKYK